MSVFFFLAHQRKTRNFFVIKNKSIWYFSKVESASGIHSSFQAFYKPIKEFSSFLFLFFIRKIVSKYFHMGIPVKLFIQQVSRKQLYQIFTEIIQDELFEQHFKCGLCKDIFLHPQKLKKCDHVFCSSCIFKEKSWNLFKTFYGFNDLKFQTLSVPKQKILVQFPRIFKVPDMQIDVFRLWNVRSNLNQRHFEKTCGEMSLW